MSATLPTSSVSIHKLASLVDQLGNINAEMKLLADQAEAIKGQLKLSGFDEVAGSLWKARITERSTLRLDPGKVKAALSPQQIMDCSVESTSTSVTLYSL